MEPHDSNIQIECKLNAEESPYRISRSYSPQSSTKPIRLTLRLKKYQKKYSDYFINYLYDKVQRKTHRNEEWKSTFMNFCEGVNIAIITTPEKYIPVTYSNEAALITSQMKFWIMLIEFYSLKYPDVFGIENLVKLSNYAIGYIRYQECQDFLSYYNNYIKNRIPKKYVKMYFTKKSIMQNPCIITDFSFLLDNTPIYYPKKTTKPMSKCEATLRQLKENVLNKTCSKYKVLSKKKSIVPQKRSPSPIRKRNIMSASVNKNKQRQTKKISSRNTTPLNKHK